MSTSEYPFISVVICAYNEEKFLASCLEGMARQSYPPDRYEVIVCDDGSADRTAEIAERFIESQPSDGFHVKLLTLSHVGLSGARNAGILNSEGSIIAFTDADAVAAPTWLAELAKPFVSGADYVGGRIDLLNRNSWVAEYLQRTRHHQIFGPRVFKEVLIGCNMAYRRKIFDEVGGFQENFVSRGDEISLRMRIPDRFRFDVAPGAVVFHNRPESVKAALRIEWFSARNFFLVRKAARQKLGIKGFVGYLEKVFMGALPLMLLLAVFFPNPFLVLSVLSALALGRRMFAQPVGRIVFVELVKYYGALRGAAAHFLYYYIPIALTIAGRPLSYWVHRNADIAASMTTPPEILRVVENR